MDVQRILSGLRARQGEILARLPRKLQAEFRELTFAIWRVELQIEALGKEDRRRRKQAASPEPCLFDLTDGEGEVQPAVNAGAAREVPLRERKVALVQYLRKTGGARRQEILRDTAIPAGSLSALLTRGGKEGWLTRGKDGLWIAKVDE